MQIWASYKQGMLGVLIQQEACITASFTMASTANYRFLMEN
jgi:hypothetical protein